MRNTRITRLRRRRRLRVGNPLLRIGQVLIVMLLLSLCGVATAFAGGVAGVVGVVDYFTRDLPDFTELEKLGTDVDTTFETTKIYAWGPDDDGDGIQDAVLIYEVIDPLGGDREWLPLDRIPQDFINATIAIEDKSFFENPGFDVEGIGRAFYEYVVKGGAIQGGSSITQQVVKNNLIDQERRIVGAEVDVDDYRRKAEELILSYRISGVYSKEQILEWYLNTNFYGNLAYGVEAAARVYYDKPASQLTLAQMAMLAAIPQSPALNPINNPEQARVRQELVLEAMFRGGFIDAEAFNTARAAPIDAQRTLEQRFDIIAPHFAQYVRRELEQRFGVEQVLRGGLTVYTSLDLTYQQQAECVTRVQVARLSGRTEAELPADELATCQALRFLKPLSAADFGVDRNVTNGAVVMMDPRTGEIKAMVGSVDYWDESIDGSFNIAADGLRQPGSSFKPFTYLTALLQGYTAATMVLDVETDFGTPYNGFPYVPQNYDRKFHGPMRMRVGLSNSYNVPAVQVMSWVGVDSVIRVAHRMGITDLEDPTNYGLALTLGGGEVKLIDMVYAFSTLANEGTMIGQPISAERQRLGFRTLNPVSILRVEDRRGNAIFQYSNPGREQVVSPQLAFVMNDMLSDTTTRCPAFGCPNSLELPDGRPVAAKTGTTNNFRDAWTVGYTPQMAVGVWLGNSNNTEMDEVPGSKGAAPVWNALMQWAMAGQPVQTWDPPAGVVTAPVCDLNGLRPSEYCPTVEEYFVQGTEPTVIDYMYQKFRISAATGKLAAPTTPSALVTEKVFVVYPEAAADWVREQKLATAPTEYDLGLGGGAPVAAGNVVILSPEPFQFVRAQGDIIGNAQGSDFASYRVEAFDAGGRRIILADGVGEARQNSRLASWNTTTVPDGPYRLVLTVQRTTGGSEQYDSLVTVDNTAPTARILFPFDNQEVLTEDEWVVVQAQVADANGIERVEFYAGGAQVPFAINTVPPFTEKYVINGPGCTSFRIRAFDGAGNAASSDPVPVCFIEPEE